MTLKSDKFKTQELLTFKQEESRKCEFKFFIQKSENIVGICDRYEDDELEQLVKQYAKYSTQIQQLEVV